MLHSPLKKDAVTAANNLKRMTTSAVLGPTGLNYLKSEHSVYLQKHSDFKSMACLAGTVTYLNRQNCSACQNKTPTWIEMLCWTTAEATESHQSSSE